MSQREEFSFVFNGVTVDFVKMYNDCWICSLPWFHADKLRRSLSDLSKLSIKELKLTNRARNVLAGENVTSIYDIVQYTEEDLLGVPGCGRTTAQNIKLALEDAGFKLRK